MEAGTPAVPERAALRRHLGRPDAGKPRRSARDPDDDYLVALAEETGAVIVTGDVTGVPPWA
jgi:hypothetical protein